MKKTPIEIKCTRCKGHGKIKLPRVFQDTLAAVQRLKQGTARDVKKALQTEASQEAINNRLEKLRNLDLLKREMLDGKTWTYSPV